MEENKKETAQEVPVQEQPIKVLCPICNETFVISKLCPSCKQCFDKECNYCGYCGTKLVNLQF